jgi:hypothetical protein
MKKILKAIGLLVVTVLLVSTANAQQVKFYYYPNSNVYYNPVAGTYSYVNNGQWVTVSSLPQTIVVKNQPKRVVYYTGTDVWNRNKVKVKSNNGVVSSTKGKKVGWTKGKGNKH